jgi:hypothetical protein
VVGKEDSGVQFEIDPGYFGSSNPSPSTASSAQPARSKPLPDPSFEIGIVTRPVAIPPLESPISPSAIQPESPNGPADRRSEPPVPFLPITAHAGRQQRYRQRKEAGVILLSIELEKTEIAVLVQKGLLKPDMQKDWIAIADAIYRLIGG